MDFTPISNEEGQFILQDNRILSLNKENVEIVKKRGVRTTPLWALLIRSSLTIQETMNSHSYFPNYFSIEDIFVTQEKVECKINTKLIQMGFLDPGADSNNLNPGKTVNLPLWYVKELKVSNPYFTVDVPMIYLNVYKAVCEAETTHIEMGKLHPFFYEYGRYLAPYDRNHIVGKIVFETIRQRVRHLLDISKNTNDDEKPQRKLDNIENKLYEAGSKTNTKFMNWLQMKLRNICISEMVQEISKKRKRTFLSDDEKSPQAVTKKCYN